jgi:hypothetical protein
MVHAGVVVALVIGAAAWLASSELVGDAQETPQEPGHLVAPGRMRLSLCVDGAGGHTATNDDVASVSTALDAALASLEAVPPEFGTPSVVLGCPPSIPLSGNRLDSNDLCCVFQRVVMDQRAVSPHLLFVYLVAELPYNQSFGTRPYATATAESYCRGDACSVMTASLYAPASAGTTVLAQGILKSVGLQPETVDPQPTLDWSSCAAGTPRPWCRTYDACLEAESADADCAELWQQLGATPAP